MRTLVALGLLLLAVGAAMLLWVFVAVPEPELTPGTGVQGAPAASGGPPPIWSVLAGLTLATGGACLGVGMNQWRQGRPRTIERPPS